MIRRAAAIAVTVLALAGCTSSGSKKTTPSPPPKSSAAPASITPDGLKAKLASITSLTSAAITAKTVVGGETISGTATARFVDGAIVAGDLTQALPAGLGTIRVVRAQGTTYAKLPSGLAKPAKPWVVLARDSTNPVYAQLASIVDSILAVASPTSLREFASAATTVTDLGPTQVDGVRTTHYALKVDATKLTASLAAGVGRTGTIPIDLYLDGQNRPIQVGGSFSLAGQKIEPTITLSKLNAPVTITAPPASEVASK